MHQRLNKVSLDIFGMDYDGADRAPTQTAPKQKSTLMAMAPPARYVAAASGFTVQKTLSRNGDAFFYTKEAMGRDSDYWINYMNQVQVMQALYVQPDPFNSRISGAAVSHGDFLDSTNLGILVPSTTPQSHALAYLSPSTPYSMSSEAPASIQTALEIHSRLLPQNQHLDHQIHQQKQHQLHQFHQFHQSLNLDTTHKPRGQLLVSGQQYQRIMKRRESRQKFDGLMKKHNAKSIKVRGYIWESRHQHAQTRPRGPNGRFLSTTEINAYKNGEFTIKDPVQRHIADEYIKAIALNPPSTKAKKSKAKSPAVLESSTP